MQFLTKDALKSAEVPPKMERVELPEYDGFIYVREMSAKARDSFENSTFSIDSKGKMQKNLANYRAKFVVRVACDETGALLFSESDVEWLGERQASLVQRIFDAGQRLNGLPGEKELEKNSPAPADDSSSS